MLFRETFELNTKKEIDKTVLTDRVEEIVKKSRVREGLCHVFCPGATFGIMLNENDGKLLKDFEKHIEKIFPNGGFYHHPQNAHSHLRASLMRSDAMLPISKGKIKRGKWQDIILWEFSTRPRKRKIIVSVFGNMG